MAEFKLGRIRFVWKGEWTSSATYYKDDVIRVGGKTYICLVGHTSNPVFYTDLEFIPARWEQMSDGQAWQGNWTTDTVYSISDIVKYGGVAYICIEGHTSSSTSGVSNLPIDGLEADLDKWESYSEGFDWKDEWTPESRYKRNDLVKYGSLTYVCINGHLSAEDSAFGLEVNIDDWQLYAEGFDWKDEWTPESRYKRNDLVKYGSLTYVCVMHHNSGTASQGLEADQEKWELFATGLDWKDEWAINTRYKVKDLVKYGGITYVCNEGHTSAATLTLGIEADQPKWDVFSTGFLWLNDWVTNYRYVKNDLVKYGGITYVCNEGHTSAATLTLGIEADQPKWDVFSTGFDWKNIWTTNTRYRVSDVVRYGGITYVCNEGHTSVETYGVVDSTIDGLEADQTKWDEMNQGFDWKDNWTPETRYKKNDLVRYGGYAYVCNEGHVSSDLVTGLEADQSKWNIFNQGTEWKGVWISSTRYKKNDIVRYGGYTYICNEGHTSAATDLLGLEADQTKWDSFNEGIEYLGDWDNNSVRHKVNDVIKVGAGLWICIEEHVSEGLFEDQEIYWEKYVEGFEFEDEWSQATVYKPGDIVRYGGNQYIARTNHSGSVPTQQPDAGITNWSLFTEGFNFVALWSIESSYRIGDVVRVNGGSYLAAQDSPSIPLTVTETSAFTNRFTVASTDGLLPGMLINFTANTFGNVAPNASFYVKAVLSLTEFTITDSPDGDTVNPTPGTGSMTAFAAIHPTNENAWKLLVGGISWRGEWEDDVEYNIGNVVRLGSNAYICIRKHRSEGDDGSTIIATGGGAADSRPDQDLTGTYWNILTIGSEISVLSVQGDLLYFSEAGPSRLPIGTEGQVLKSTSNLIAWDTLGKNDFTYYVGQTGQDLPVPLSGISVDRPFKTIRFAADQVEKGPRNPNAQRLLEYNRTFIQREVTAWIEFQITNATVGSIWEDFTYNAAKCERDVGFIVDRLKWDIGHGGNLKIRAAAQSLLGVLSDGPFSKPEKDQPYLTLNNEYEQSAAAYEYMLEVINAVFKNRPPAVIYQFLSSNFVEDDLAVQFIDATIPAEESVYSTVVSLVSIITDALENQDPSNIPERFSPTNLIRVMTGKYRETLPIIVPASTCIQGDELRSTNAGPSTSVVDMSDTYYTVETFDRVNQVVADIVVGNTVLDPITLAPTIGNTATQYAQWPYATASESLKVSKLVNVMKQQSDFRVNQIHAAELTDPIGYNTSYLEGFGNARKLIRENREFLQLEVLGFMEENFPDLRFSRTSTKRDTGLILDALIYDLTYGGNKQSVEVGLTYYSNNGTVRFLDESLVDSTIQYMAFLQAKAVEVVSNVAITGNLYQTNVPQFRNTPASLAAIAVVIQNIEIVADIVQNSIIISVSPEITLVAADYGITGIAFVDNTTVIATASAWPEGGEFERFIATPLNIEFVAVVNSVTTVVKILVEFDEVSAGVFEATVSTSVPVDNASPSSVTLADELRNPVLEDGVNTTTALISAYNSLISAIPQIQTDTIDFVNSTFGEFTYSSLCRRDSELLVDAGYFDAAFGSNFWAVQNGLSYYRPQASLVLTAQKAAEIGSVRFIRDRAAEIMAASPTAVSRSNATYNEIIDILENGILVADQLVYTDPGVDAQATIARTQLVANRAYIIVEITNWINDQITAETPGFVGLTYDVTLCERDIGFSVDALAYDAQYSGNMAIRNIARSLFDNRTGVSVYPVGQQDASAATYDQLGIITADIVRNLYSGQANVGGDAGATKAALMVTLTGHVSAVITADSLTGVVAESRPVITWATSAIQTAVTAFDNNKDNIVKGTLQFISDNFNSFTYDHARAEKNVRLALEAVGYDFMLNTNFQTLKTARGYLSPTSAELFANVDIKAATRGSLEFARTQAILNVNNDTIATARINNLMDLMDTTIFGATNNGDIYQSETPETYYASILLERNKTFIVEEIRAYIDQTYSSSVTDTTSVNNIVTVANTGWLRRNTSIKFVSSNNTETFGNIEVGRTYYVFDVVNSTSFKVAETRNASEELQLTIDATQSIIVKLDYNSDLCLRDVVTYIDALKFDLQYPGNYKSRYVARYYANAVNGSLEEDMYYLRDGTGIRDMTLDGLSGDLTPPNEFGTSRTTAGAYCSLDPGFGPADFNTWIISRSPYVQGVTTFGKAAIGQKIDGALHNGGNDSIVSNDFTQVISDGIGAWITNNGRAELVSVFSYYAHIAYLAENGGRIRATNGNNSYGEFGSVAEGFDNTEIPNTGIVDNYIRFRATVENVITDAIKLLAFEFENAGRNYTSATWTLTGGGFDADVVSDELRDNAISYVRLLELAEPGNDGEFGGTNFLTSQNTVQAGTTTTVNIAATDTEPATAYVGMKIVINGGTGIGQYGIASTYNAATKLIEVVREEDGQPGWSHFVPGTTIVAPDQLSTYIIEPRISFTAPGFASTASTLPSSDVWVDTIYLPTIKTYIDAQGVTSANGSGALFTVLKEGVSYRLALTSGGINHVRLETITIFGSQLGGVDENNDIVIIITSVDPVTGAILAFDQESFGLGGKFLALPNVGSIVLVSSDGITWTNSGDLGSGGWTSFAAGKIIQIAPAGNFIVGQSYTIVNGGDTIWQNAGAASNQPGTTFVATSAGDGSGTAEINSAVIVAIKSASNETAYSTDDGETWQAGGILPSSIDWASIAYGEGRWLAIARDSSVCATSINGGLNWLLGGTLPVVDSWEKVTFGAGRFVVIASNSNRVIVTVNGGQSWSSGTLPSTSNWSSVAFGNNRFIAVSETTGTTAAYSIDNGTTWQASTLPASAAWSHICYGQGVFLALSSTAQAATSEEGLYWTSRTMSTSANGYGACVFGNPERKGIFAAVQAGTAGTVASYVKTGVRTRARAVVSSRKIVKITMLEPGSGYESALPTMTITDPSRVFEAPFEPRRFSGVLANPTYKNRGLGFITGSATIDSGDGNAEFYQFGNFVGCRRITDIPVPGSNLVFGHLPDRVFKVVNVVSFTGDFDGSYEAFFQLSPALSIAEAPEDGVTIITRIRYSQVRLTGHDFLDIGTGNFEKTNYPGLPFVLPDAAKETKDANGGRVFFTSTDQDGNFRVGDLFAIEQSTGVATLNADAFNISGLNELQLGNITLGGTSATVTEFSTDPFFTADSDNVIPTQRAVKAFIASQIGGGGANLNVNTITAGSIFIGSNVITTTTGETIQMRATFEFRGGVSGMPAAFGYFLT